MAALLSAALLAGPSTARAAEGGEGVLESNGRRLFEAMARALVRA